MHRSPSFTVRWASVLSTLALLGTASATAQDASNPKTPDGPNPSTTRIVRPDWAPAKVHPARSQSVDPIFVRFDAWVQRHAAAAATDRKVTREPEGIALASARREALAALIRTNPRQALDLAVPWSLRGALPDAVRSQLEEQISGRGDFQVYAIDDWSGSRLDGEVITRQVRIQDRTFNAFVYGKRSHQISTPNTLLHGIALGSDMALHEDPARVLEPDEALALQQAGKSPTSPTCTACGKARTDKHDDIILDAAGALLRACSPAHAAWLNRQLFDAGRVVLLPDGGDVDPIDPGILGSLTQGTKNVLFMRVNFADDITEPISEAEATDLMNQVHAHYVESSFNTTALISTITPLLPLPQTKLWYGTNGPGSLLQDARKAALTAGYAFEQYDLDLVRHTSVPGFDWGGLASVGGRGLWLQSSGFGVVVHELGHNYGLVHANAWNTAVPARTANYPDNPANDPFDPDSLIGHDSVIGPGTDGEYGDPFDIMGGGGGHFNAVGKNILGWLPEPYVQTVSSNGTYRIHAMDAALLTAGRHYALRVQKDFERDYWGSYRTRLNNPWLLNGLELHWNSWSQANGFSDFLDSTPGTPSGKQDAAIVLGRTFSDATASVHLTPIAQGGSSADAWMDVVVHRNTPLTNLPPIFTFSATSTQVSTNMFVDFTATASDQNGDALAYHWDFGDDTFGPNARTVSKRWTTDGDYVVRCEVSDMKGGLASAYQVITVGSPGTYRISGRVLDISGNPLQGVRVHNGMARPDYRSTQTDSEGRYTIANLAPGTYTNAAFRFGYRTAPFSFLNPINLVGADASDMDYLAAPLPTVSVTTSGTASESSPKSGSFTLSRTSPTNLPQVVLFQIDGTAPPAKYTLTTASVTLTNVGMNEGFGRAVTNTFTFSSIIIPAGTNSTTLVVDPVNNTTSEGTQTVSLTLALPVQALGFITDTNITNSVFVPGWESLPVNLQPTWFQSYPDYALTDRASEATIAIRDDEPPGLPAVSILALDDVATESGQDLGVLVFLRLGPSDNPLTVFYTVGGSATPVTDYTPLPGSITFPAGQSFVILPVQAVENLFAQPSRSVSVTLTTNATYTIANASATVTLVDDDLPTVVLNAPEPVAQEDTQPGSFLVTRIGDLSQDLPVSYLVAGTALGGRDYRALDGTVVIPANRVSASIPVQPLDNRSQRGDLTVIAHLADTPIYNVGTPRSATVVIQEKELPTVTITTTTDPAAEPSTPGVFTVTRTGGTSTNLTVRFISGGSAIAGSDYSPIGNSIVIPAGTNSIPIIVTPSENRHREEPETVVVRLVTNPAYNVGVPYQAILNLNDSGSTLPAVGFILSTFSGPESEAAPVVAVAISANPDEAAPVTVDYRVTGGSALTNIDFQLTGTNTLFFTNNGPRIQDLPLTILDNSILQPNRTIIFTLLDPGPTFTNEVDPDTGITNIVTVPTPTNAYFDVFRTHIYTIRDDDLATVTVTATDPIARESGPKPGLLTFTRAGLLTQPLVVSFQVTGSASSGSDFVPLGSSITIPAGTNTATLAVVPLDNPTEDPPQTVIVTLVGVPGGKIGSPGTATVTIVDNDGTLQFTASAFTVSEPAGFATVEVQRTGDSLGTDTVDYAVAPGTATSGLDFVRTNGTLRFGPGETVRSFLVPVLDDTSVEPNETIQLTLLNPTGGLPLGGQRTAVLTIHDDDTALAFASPIFLASEHSTNGLVTVQRLGVATNKVTIEFQTADGSARSGSNYIAQTGLLQFSAGETQQTFSIPLLNNTLAEGDLTIDLALLNPSGGATLNAPSNAVLRIVDDECALHFEVVSTTVLEYASLVTLNVRRSGGTVHPVQADYRTRDGSARAGTNYLAQNGTIRFTGDAFLPSTNGTGLLEFHPGETNQVVSIVLLDNTLGHADRTFELSLSNPKGPIGTRLGTVTLGLNTNAIVTILDDERPGYVDYAFNPGAINGRVLSLSLQPDRSVVFGGEFTTVDGVLFNRVARLHPDGHSDSSFNPGMGADDSVFAIASQPDGKVLVGGDFNSFDGINLPRLARLNADGTLDLAFDPGSGADRLVRTLAPGPDGTVLAGGDFTTFNGMFANRYARLAANGTIDPTFQTAGASDSVLALAVQPDGKLLLAGRFTGIGSRSAGHIARLNPDGSVDDTFNPGAGTDGPVHALALQSDGRILIGGTFTDLSGASAVNLARLLPDGSVDFTFNPGADIDGTIHALAVAPDGGIYVGGAFTRLQGATLNRFALLNPDGSLNLAFNHGSGANGTVLSLAAQPDGALIIAGDFTQVHDVPRAGIARIHAGEMSASSIVEFSSTSFSVSEAAGNAVIPVVRTGNLQAEFTVEFLTRDGTALAGTRYTAQSGTLSFAAGQSTKSISIPILDGSQAEGNQFLDIILTNASAGATLGLRTVAVLTVLDDEAAISFVLPQVTINENSGSATVEISRTGTASSNVTVDYASSDGTATGLDYVPRQGTLTFGVGETTRSLLLPILNDSLAELDETFTLTLSNPTGGAVLGSQQTIVVTIADDDAPPQFHLLTLRASLGGSAFPPSGSYATNSSLLLIATPEPNYEFAGWIGTVSSSQNPLSLTLDRNYDLTATFRPRTPTDDFESAGLGRLAWTTTGAWPWFITSNPDGTNRFTARSGLIGDNQSSSLIVTFTAKAGTGAFAYRVNSEQDWDFLEFHHNGTLLARWSGIIDWQTFRFPVQAGPNVCEWRYSKDANFSVGSDTAYIDNVYLPVEDPSPANPAAVLTIFPMPMANPLIRLQGLAGRSYVLEQSTDLVTWTPLSTNTLPSTPLFFPTNPTQPKRFYRATTSP